MPQPTAPPVELVPTSRLFCSSSNPRQNDASVSHVAASLRRFGWQQPVVARRTGEVIAGNTRLKAAQQLGLMEVPVWWFDGSGIDAVAYAVADNKTHEFAQWDDAALARLLEQLREEDSLDGVGFDDQEIDRLITGLAAEESASLDDPGAEPPYCARQPSGTQSPSSHRTTKSCGPQSLRSSSRTPAPSRSTRSRCQWHRDRTSAPPPSSGTP